MILPNCHQKYARDAYPYGSQYRRPEDFGEDERNPYWDQQLKGSDKAFLQGYDAFEQHVACAFFQNAEPFIGDDEIDYSVLEDDRLLDEIPEKEWKRWQPKTLLMKKLYDGLLHYAEDTRNEIGHGKAGGFSESEPHDGR